MNTNTASRPAISRLPWLSRRLLVALPSLVVAGFFLSAASAQTITSAVPGYITYQGKVTNTSGTPVGSGTPVNRKVIFRIWGHQSNSTVTDLVYAEEQTVTISEGEFSVLIGQGVAVTGTPLGYSEAGKGPPSVTLNNSFAIFGGAARYLGVTIDDGTAAADPEVSPRQQLVTAPYAFRARFAEGLGTNGGFSVAVTDQGNFGVGIANPLFPLTTAATLGDKVGLFGNFNYGLGIQANNVQLHGASSADDITFGYGTSAAMTETMRIKGNGNVGIGTATPSAKLDVNGAINVFDAGVKSFSGGLVTEVGAQMINFGINDTRFGATTNNASQGGFFRVNTQSASNLFQFYARPAAGSTITEVMSITGGGNVGLGSSSPTARLDVNGAIMVNSGIGNTATRPAVGAARIAGEINSYSGSGTFQDDGFLRLSAGGGTSGNAKAFIDLTGYSTVADMNSAVVLGTAGAERMRITSGGNIITGSGNVGIGTSSPAAKLHVNGGVRVDSTNVIEFGGGLTKEGSAGKIGYNTFTGDALDIVGAGTTGSNRKIKFWNEGGAIFSGWVSVTSGTPAAPLHVANWTGVTFNVEAWGNTGGFGDVANQSYNLALGAIIDSGIRAAGFYVNSDARIKEVRGRSSGAADLATLQKIEVTDFAYRDPNTYGGRDQKKVIAQQVEQVFPQAVGQMVGVVPDIFSRAGAKDGWVMLTTDLKVGERVQLIADGRRDAHEVLEVQPGRFRTNFKPAGDQVFVYGREVKDFRSVDYEAIAMLNVSATQEIKREKDAEVAALRSENATLRERLATLEAKERTRDAKLAAIEKLLQSSQTVMAQPVSRHTPGEQE